MRNHWTHLPCELHERIFTLLPISSVLTSRAVCKSWRRILSSEVFLRGWSTAAAPVPWFLMFQNHVFKAYDPALGAWHDIPISSEFSVQMNFTCVVASSGGLIFLTSQKKQQGTPPTLFICNPLTLSCRVLPCSERISLIYVMGMVSVSPGSYKVLVTGVSGDRLGEVVTEIYDSDSGAWLYCGSESVGLFEDFSGMRAVFCRGYFYALSVPPYKLLAFDMENNRWSKLLEVARTPYESLSNASLFVCRDRMVMAAKVVCTRGARVRVWEFDNSRFSEVISGKTERIMKEFCRCLTYFMNMEERGMDSVCFNSWCRWRTLMYDVYKMTWHWLPEHCGRFKDMFSGLTYEPTFLARA